ncbi:PqqD family protein [bacterium]|nr:PqqD family protein [bacterium]
MAKKPEPNLLDLIPVHHVEWQKNDSEQIDLIVPKFRHPLMQKWMKRLGKSPVLTVHLDLHGSYIWLCINGSDTVEEIAGHFQKQFGEEIEPVYDRLTAFIRILKLHKYIQLKTYSGQ